MFCLFHIIWQNTQNSGVMSWGLSWGRMLSDWLQIWRTASQLGWQSTWWKAFTNIWKHSALCGHKRKNMAISSTHSSMPHSPLCVFAYVCLCLCVCVLSSPHLSPQRVFHQCYKLCLPTGLWCLSVLPNFPKPPPPNPPSPEGGSSVCILNTKGCNYSHTLTHPTHTPLGFYFHTVFSPSTGGACSLLLYLSAANYSHRKKVALLSPTPPPPSPTPTPRVPATPRSFPTSSLPVSHSRFTAVSQGSALGEPKLLLFLCNDPREGKMESKKEWWR